MRTDPGERRRGMVLSRSITEVIAVTVVALVIELGNGAIPPGLMALASSGAVAGAHALVHGSGSFSAEESATVARGIYFGWVAGAESRFLLSGAPCAEDASPQVAEIYGGDLLPSGVMLPEASVSSFEAPLAAGRELLVTALSSTALVSPFTGTNASLAVAATTIEGMAFNGLRARCRTWQEIDSDLGDAGVLLLPAIPRPGSPEEPAARAGPLHDAPMLRSEDKTLEAHVLPLPDRTNLLALLLLWNRTPAAITVASIHYAPAKAATDLIVAVTGTFDDYDQLEAKVLGVTTTSVSTTLLHRNAGALELDIEPGGIALLGLDRDSFVTSRPRAAGSAQLVYLGFPVIAYQPLPGDAGLHGQDGLPANRHAEPGRAPVADSAEHLAMSTPLYARWSLTSAR